MIGSDLEFLADLVKSRREIGVVMNGEVRVVAQVRQKPYGGADTSQCVWPSSLVLSQYLVDEFAGEDKKLRVLELGCGLGVVSRTAKVCLDWDVTASDMTIPDLPSEIKCVVLEWGTSAEIQLIQEPSFDLILGADLIYNQASHVVLAQTFGKLLNETNRCLMTYQIRNHELEDQFLNVILPMYGLTSREIPLPSVSSKQNTGNVEIASETYYRYVRLVELKKIKACETDFIANGMLL